VWARVALFSNDERCSIVAGVLGVTGSSERDGRGYNYVGPTISVCHVITWMGGRYMKDRSAFGHLVSGYTSYIQRFLPRLLKEVGRI